VVGLQNAWAEQGYDLALNVNSPVISMLRLARGELESAEMIARPFAESDPDDRPTERALSVTVLAEVLYEWNRLDEAERVLRTGLRMLEQAAAIGASEPIHILLARVLWARQDAAGALAELDAASEVASALQNLTCAHEAEAWRVQFALAGGDREQARRWIKQRELSVEGEFSGATMVEWLVFARVLIATAETEQALHLLERLRTLTRSEGDRHHLIKVLILESLAYLDLFQLDQGVDSLAEALTLAESGHYLRMFINEGMPMVRLLRIAHRRGTSVQFIRDLLEAVGETPEEIVRIDHQELVEPITPREIQVLGLIALGLTNKEIGEELYLTVGTVKRHVTNLYGKLGVANRTEAVQRARKLQLLAPSPPARPA
jgi:LuxR family maltose regulon positive regulatory protein